MYRYANTQWIKEKYSFGSITRNEYYNAYLVRFETAAYHNGEQAGVDLAEREENRARIATLERIVDTGTCSTPPPIFGWLIENSLITENGFDMAKVRAMLDELRGV